MIETATFVCSICGESSTDICVYCTKDTCSNHRCLRCLRCSDCCECEVPLTAGEPMDEPLPHPLYAEPEAPPEPVFQPGLTAPAGQEPEFAQEQVEVPGAEPQAEITAIIAIIPEPQTLPEVSEAATREELVRALPELFAPEKEEPPKPASEAEEANPPDSEPEPDEKQ